MSWRELSKYIDGLHTRDSTWPTLTVQWQKKIAYPLMAPVSMLLAIPFALLVGTRGAIGGVALGVAYRDCLLGDARTAGSNGRCWAVAAAARGMVAGHYFLFSGMYFFFKMPT